MKIFLAWCCVAIALGMIALLISSVKDYKLSAEGFVDFLFTWLCDSSEVLGFYS